MNSIPILLCTVTAMVSAPAGIYAWSYNSGYIAAVVPVVVSDEINPKYNEGVLMLETKLVAVSIATAVESFYDDYNRLPRPRPASKGADSETTTKGGEGIVTVLIGKESGNEITQNPLSTNYVGSLKPAQPNKNNMTPSSGGKLVNGIIFVNDNYEIVDSWGNHFRMKLDTTYDKKIENPQKDEITQGRRHLLKRVIVWSAGPDGKEETWEDNPKSW